MYQIQGANAARGAREISTRIGGMVVLAVKHSGC